MSALPCPSPLPTTIDQVIARLDRIIEDAVAANSRLGYFAALYNRVTIAVRDGIRAGAVAANARMEFLDATTCSPPLCRWWRSRSVPSHGSARHYHQDMARIESINTSRGGVPKTSVFEAFLAEQGVSGDAQVNRDHHGGPDRAVVLYSLEVIRALQAEGHPIGIGTTGENLTVSGLDWNTIVPGTRLQAGGALLEVTSYASPCRKIGPSFIGHAYTRIGQEQNPGWSRVCARVLTPGLVQPGDEVRVV